MRTIATIILCLFIVDAQAEKRDFSRYQSIVDRQMFGQLPPNFDPTKPPSEVSRAEQKELTKEQEKLQSAIHFSVIQVSPEGEVRVGFTDNSDPKVPRHYALLVGETRDGWTVKEADAAEQSMTIEKDGIEVSLKIGEDSKKGGGTTARPGANANASTSRSSMPPRPTGGSGLFGGKLSQRRQMRLQQEREAQAAREAKAAEEKAEREEKAAAEKAEREEQLNQQRQQLLAIQEELKKQREEKERKAKEEEQNENNDAQ